jgi:hypothetical protein
MTTAPNGELRRQDLHLQVQQLVSLRSLQGVPWASLPHLLRYYAPRRLPPARLGPLRLSLASRYLACFRRFVVSPQGSWAGRSPPRTPGLLVVRSPFPGVAQGDRWLSQVPEFPLEIHAPLSDPGGVPSARQSVAGRDRTAARTTLGGEFPALALSICKVGA